MTAAGAGAITGIGLTSGQGFFVGMTAGFFGMPASMRVLRLEIKPATLMESPLVPMPTGLYRTKHPSDRRPSHAERNDYVELPATMEREFQKRLALTASQLDEQRARIKREAEIARASTSAGKNTVSRHAL